jgi:hypothetical protein
MTNFAWQLKLILGFGLMALLALSISLWLNTPDLFVYFNQAFCAH